MPDPTPAAGGDVRRTTWPTAEPLQQAADLRRAAGDPLLADWLDATANALAWLAPYRDNEPGYGMWEAALAVARQLLGTTTTEGAAAEPPAARRARYAAAIRETDGWVLDDGQHMIDAVMAVADAEQASLRAEVEGLDEALRGAISASEKDGARLRAELTAAPPAPAGRAAFEALAAEWEKRGEYGHSSITDRARELRAVLAGEAAAGVQQTTEAHHTVDGARYLCHTDDHYCPQPPAAPAAPEEPTR
ncbi:hypothetical protein ACOMD4_15790 [Streptomyces anulatus]|uniref:hypothetical protein n=1 Tax=Streptomyces anulatus TaxID=1892 RepID=UPI003B7A8441